MFCCQVLFESDLYQTPAVFLPSGVVFALLLLQLIDASRLVHRTSDRPRRSPLQNADTTDVSKTLVDIGTQKIRLIANCTQSLDLLETPEQKEHIPVVITSQLLWIINGKETITFIQQTQKLARKTFKS